MSTLILVFNSFIELLCHLVMPAMYEWNVVEDLVQ